MSQSSEDHPLTGGDKAFWDAQWKQWTPPIFTKPNVAEFRPPQFITLSDKQFLNIIEQAVEKAVEKTITRVLQERETKTNETQQKMRRDRIALGPLSFLSHLQLPEDWKILVMEYDPVKDNVTLVIERPDPPTIPLD